MTTSFLDLFATVPYVTETLLSFVSPNDAMRIRRTCAVMYKAVWSCLPENIVKELASNLLKLNFSVEFSLKSAPEKCKRHFFFVECALRRNGLDYQAASENLQRDPLVTKIALVSVKVFDPARLKNLLEVINSVAASKMDIPKFVRSIPVLDSRESWVKNGFSGFIKKRSFKKDRDIVLSVVRQDGQRFMSVNSKFRSDKDIVLAAVTQCGWIFEFASPALQADKEFVLAVVRKNGLAFMCTDAELQKDKDIVLAAVTQNGSVLEFVSPKMQADKDVVLAAVTQDGWALEFASSKLLEDKDVVSAAVSQNGWALKFASPKLKANREVVLAAVRRKRFAILFAIPEFQLDKEILSAAARS